MRCGVMCKPGYDLFRRVDDRQEALFAISNRRWSLCDSYKDTLEELLLKLW